MAARFDALQPGKAAESFPWSKSMVCFNHAPRFVITTLLAALAEVGTASAFAQAPEVVRVRGEVVSFDGAKTIVVKPPGHGHDSASW
jgi:hypothetical protein